MLSYVQHFTHSFYCPRFVSFVCNQLFFSFDLLAHYLACVSEKFNQKVQQILRKQLHHLAQRNNYNFFLDAYTEFVVISLNIESFYLLYH